MNILITGASRGIGFQVAKHLLEERGNRVIALSRDSEGLNDLKQSVSYPQNLSIHSLDITAYTSEELLTICDPFEAIDVIINNAGLLVNKLFAHTSLEEWRRVFEVNLFAPVKIIQDLLPHLRKAEHPHIINIGSMGGYQGSIKFKGLSAYSSSKAALANLTECLAEELKDDGVAVNCLCLGAVNTEMLNEAFPDFSSDIESEEMAEFIVDFALNRGKFMNGKVLPISTSTP